MINDLRIELSIQLKKNDNQVKLLDDIAYKNKILQEENSELIKEIISVRKKKVKK
jgi:hypothetical protein